jgi:Flp pilus assembly pilin Flp
VSDRLRKWRHAFIDALASLMVARPARRRARAESGAALVEYSLILGLVVIAGIAALLLIGGHVSQDLSNTARGFGP